MSQIRPYSRCSSRRQGFTLIEILIAIGLFLVLLVVILVPLNQAFRVFNTGRSSIALQSAADSTVKTIAAELRGAVAVYPNAELPGVTDRAPYAIGGLSAPPYYQGNVCDNTKRVNNPARIDFILPVRSTADGSVELPVRPERYVITYFTQRQKAITAPGDGFDEFSNPIGIYRTRTLYEESNGDAVQKMNYESITTLPLVTPKKTSRYNAVGCDADWLRQLPATTKLEASAPFPPAPPPYRAAEPQIPNNDDRVMVSPRDTAVNYRYIYNPSFPTDKDRAIMQPDLNFACEDSDGNGIIDRVTISLTFVQYEDGASGSSNVGQRVTATQIVNLPNARFRL